MKCKQLALRVLSTAAVLSIVSSIAAPVFAETYYIGNNYDLKIEAKDDGKVYVNDHEDKDGEITIKGGTGKDSLSEKNEEKKEQETGENSGAEKQNVTEETPGEKTSADEGETKKQDAPSENSDEGKDSANENKKDDVPAAGESPQPKDAAEPEEKTIKKGSASGSENALTALQSGAAPRSAPEENTSAGNSPVSNVINVVNNWADKILKITLDNVNIKTEDKSTVAAMSVSGSGDTEVDLVGDNVLDSSSSEAHAGLEKAFTVASDGTKTNDSGKLIITAADNNQTLTATGGHLGAGIGSRSGGYRETLDSSKAEVDGIEINGGKITANGGDGGAAIGGGSGTIGEVTINGGDITATGGYYSAGIGGGWRKGGFVTINEGIVNATSGNEEGCGIGGGQWSRGGEIKINGGDVTARSKQGGAGIGGTNSTVTITNGTVNATGGGLGAGIGGYGAGVTISGGSVTAAATVGGAGIGQPGGARAGFKPGKIEITGPAQVTATGGVSNSYYDAGAAIGNGGDRYNNRTENNGKEVEVVTGKSTTATIVRNPTGMSAAHTAHEWGFVSHVDATVGHPGETVYHCACGADRTDYSPALPMPEPDNSVNSGTNSGTNSEAGYAPLTVLGADSFEQTTEDDRLIITVPEESASLTGSLAALRELESSGIRTLVFRTRHCESSVQLADLTAQGSDEAVFVLSHSGENASLTLDGRDLTGLLA